MAKVERQAHALWKGNLTEGEGVVTMASGAAPGLPVTWASRTEAPAGRTSPEELVAAAHASCFAMALASDLTKAGHPPEQVEADATCSLEKLEGGWTVTTMELRVRARVPGIDDGAFQKIAEGTKENCPISRLLKSGLRISMGAELVS